MRPSLREVVHSKQHQQKVTHDKQVRARKLVIDDTVFIRNFTTGSKWLPGVVIEVKGDLTIYGELEDGRVVRRHIDHVRKRSCSTSPGSTNDDSDDLLPPPNISTPPHANVPQSSAPSTISIAPLRRSTRVRQPPNRFMNVDDTLSYEGGVY